MSIVTEQPKVSQIENEFELSLELRFPQNLLSFILEEKK